VFGLHAVDEYLRSAGTGVLELRLSDLAHPARQELQRLASAAAVPVTISSSGELDRLCEHGRHQGAVVLLREFAYADLEDVAARQPDLIVAADGVEDPRNLGALIRAAAAAGAGAVVIPKDRAAPVTPVVEKAAAGVTAWFPVVRVVNLGRAIEELKDAHRYWVAALSGDGRSDLYGTDLPRPAVLLVGGESGLRPLLRNRADFEIRIPMAAGVESLNLAVAVAVASFELRRRWSATP
jgi:23S rRNA (guanosine2251-2'-O)-methyltransferase